MSIHYHNTLLPKITWADTSTNYERTSMETTYYLYQVYLIFKPTKKVAFKTVEFLAKSNTEARDVALSKAIFAKELTEGDDLSNYGFIVNKLGSITIERTK